MPKVKKKHTCIACEAKLPEQKLIELNNMPASAQDIPGKEEITDDAGIDLDLFQCGKCGLVQFDYKPVSYYKDVIRSGGFTTTMVELRRRQYQYIIDKYQLEGNTFIEVGCGQGEFLSILSEFNVQTYGIEHRKELMAIAQKNGLNVWQDFASDKNHVLKNPYGVNEFDVFLSFNFLEHQPNPKDMLECIYRNLSEEAMGLITVPSLEYILQYDGYYELIRDHLAYYTFETLESLLNSTGFEVLEREMINRDTLSVIVKKQTIQSHSEYLPVKPIDITGLEHSIGSINLEIAELLSKARNTGKKLALWGASHQGFTLASTTSLKEYASYIIDSAPFKQGKFAPASHLSIVAPEYFFKDPVDTILIVAPGYTDEIAQSIRTRFGEQIQVLVLKSQHIEEYTF